MMSCDDISAFYNLKEIMESGLIEESSDLYLILTTYLRRSSGTLWDKAILTDPSVIKETYQLSFNGIEKNPNQVFLPVNFFNGVSTLGTLSDYSETKRFINKWVGKVHTRYPSSVLKYASALNAFRNEKYNEVIPLLRGLEFDLTVYRHISSCLAIICLLYTSPSPRDATLSRMPSSA